jgi:hypothetical protein
VAPLPGPAFDDDPSTGNKRLVLHAGAA